MVYAQLQTTPSTDAGSFRLTTKDDGKTYDFILLTGSVLLDIKRGATVRFTTVPGDNDDSM